MNNRITFIRLGDVSVNLAEHKLSNGSGETTTLQPKIIEVLAFIATHYPRLISRSELVETVWDGNYLVGEKALTNAIWVLRQSFKQIAPDSDIIETVRKSGYKLLVEPKIEYADEQEEPVLSKNRSTGWSKLFGLTLVLVLILTVKLWRTDDSFTRNKAEILNITTELGSEVFPSVSPDGRLLAFKWVRPGYPTDLFIKDLTQTKPSFRQVTFDGAAETGPVWSRDGTEIFYLKKESQTLTCSLVRLHLESNQTKRLANCPYAGYTQIDISPNGKYIAYKGQPENGGKSSIYLLNIQDGLGIPQRFTCLPGCEYNDRDVAFSPNGKRLAVSRRTDDFHENIVVIDIESKAEIQLTNNFKDINGLTWHPSGRSIIFAVQRADQRQGMVIDINSREIRDLDIDGFSFPRYSPSGDLFYHRKIEKYQISSIDLSMPGSPTVRPVLLSSYSHKNPDYSDAVGKLVYVSNESGYYELWESDKDGSHRRQLTYLNSEVNFPAWSQDGRLVVFTAPKSDGYGDQLNILNVESGKVEAVATEYQFLGRPSWSFDGKYIYSVVYSSKSINIFAFALDGSDAIRMTENNGRYAQAYGQENFFYSKRNGSLWMKRINTSDGETEILDKEQFGVKYVWDIVEEGIFFYHDDEHKHRINFYNFNRQEFRAILDLAWLKDDQYGSLSASTENNLLFLTVSEYPQTDIKRLKNPLTN